MPISGVVLTMADNFGRCEAALQSLRDHPNIQVGDIRQHRVPIVVDTASTVEDSEVWTFLNELPGVQFVDLVCVHDLSVNGASHDSMPH